MLQHIIRGSFLLAMVGAVSGCMMGETDSRSEDSQNPIVYDQGPKQENMAKKNNTVTKASVANEPVQKYTPGPKRAAAPQLPVIQ